jgi:hypothetical protein
MVITVTHSCMVLLQDYNPHWQLECRAASAAWLPGGGARAPGRRSSRGLRCRGGHMAATVPVQRSAGAAGPMTRTQQHWQDYVAVPRPGPGGAPTANLNHINLSVQLHSGLKFRVSAGPAAACRQCLSECLCHGASDVRSPAVQVTSHWHVPGSAGHESLWRSRCQRPRGSL